MYHIVKLKTGYQVVAIAGNGEVLSTSEILKSKPACIKNLKAIEKYSSIYGILFQDDTKKQPVVLKLHLGVISKADITAEPKYIPGKNPVKKKK